MAEGRGIGKTGAAIKEEKWPPGGGRRRSSISNGMLQHQRGKDAGRKTQRYHIGSSEVSSEEDVGSGEKAGAKRRPGAERSRWYGAADAAGSDVAARDGRRTGSGRVSPPSRKPSTKKSIPVHAEQRVLKPIDSQLVTGDPHSWSNTTLPEFNKRPLTDTPIVSSVTSPNPRDQWSDFGDTDEDEGRQHDGSRRERLAITRNISDLNLSGLSQIDFSSVGGRYGGHTSPAESVEESRAGEGSPDVPLSPSDDMRKLSLNDETRESLLEDVPTEIRRSFDKTPSLEQLKTLLMKKPPPPARKAYTLNIPGQTSSKISPDGRIASVDVGSKLVIVMVGLPARGKSYITNKLARYLNWLQHDCRVFNVGNTRRLDKENNAGPENNPLPDINTPNNESNVENISRAASANNTPNGHNSGVPEERESISADGSAASNGGTSHNAEFFNPENSASYRLREKWAMDTLDQLLNYVLDGSGSVGIFDATNSTKQRRAKILRKIRERSNGELKVLFLESICSDPSIIESNIRLKLSGPDYKKMDPEVALKDFVGRLQNYEKAYETIDEAEEESPGFQYVKMIDVGKKVVSYNIQGFLASQTVYFLLNFNLCERQIWITRHGESVDNLSGRIGGNARLTKRGQKFARTLARFMDFQRKEFRKHQLERFSTRLELHYSSGQNGDNKEPASVDSIPTEPNFCVWTSMLLRSIETGSYFNENLFSVKAMRMLNELGGGKLEGMTYDEIKKKYPKQYDMRIHNKLSYRYPGVGGESYLDVLTRLRPLITEVERTTDHLLIISHRVVLRILLAYFLNLEKSTIGELDVPLHTLYCLESKPYGTDYRMYEYDEHLDWFVQVQPDHQKNMKEAGVVYKERKYSVVPTAPPSSSSKKGRNSIAIGSAPEQEDFSIRKSIDDARSKSEAIMTIKE
ncbi:Piso0_002124 [Millerozyma farinosa CBS 7064]|uniref:Piso0_002124 protein n=1 Tax=Pichia sorbitophila (strain ATCC MYA-4447 / BCRC 22081 / CBS 7064 / NBRC 10061 / NRRL Y-12695) TaxID=559304 RepID=G8YE68_PICSO|nr:Piso0_002124 [Millerozyma farinosa CBS 7064]